MLNEKLEEISKINSVCLAHSDVDCESVSLFCFKLKNSCEELREAHLLKTKKDEQDFCMVVVKEIIKNTRLRAKEIFSNPNLMKEDKIKLLIGLAYVSQSQVALTKVQHRFGGRLGYHCLSHSQLIARYPDALAMCAGANHDVVMRYLPAPNFSDPKIIKLREEYHQLRSSVHPFTEAHRLMYASHKDRIKSLKGMTEQKRLAGWKAGCSERDSFNQMEVQLTQLADIIGACDEDQRNHDVIDRFKSQLDAQQSYRAALIKGTIAHKNDFSPAGLGDKLNTIGNASVFPSPAVLAVIEQPLRSRLVRLMDRVIVQLKGSDSPSFQQALEEISDANTFYQQVAAATKANPGTDLEEVKANVRRGMKKERVANHGAQRNIPRFEVMDEAILLIMPPYNDPMKPLKDVPQEALIDSMREQMLRDLKENKDMALLQYFRHQMEITIVGNLDLGGPMRKEAIDSIQNWIIGLIAEENPYQAQSFFSLLQILPGKSGVVEDEVLRLLEKKYERDTRGVSENDYLGALEFLDFAYYLINENLPFSQGAILRSQLYIYCPMKALQKVFEDPLCEGYIADSDREWFVRTLQIYEDLFCKNGKLRDEVLQKLRGLIDACSSLNALCGCILKAMKQQFGPHFLNAPHDYGYTKGKNLCSDFLREQDNAQLL